MIMKIKPFMRAAAMALVISIIMALMPVIALGEGYSAVVMEKNMPVYSDTGMEEKIGKLARGSIVVVESTAGAAAKITYANGKKEGYCDLSDLSAVGDMAEAAVVTADKAKVYAKKKASSKSKKIEKGTEVNVLGVSGKWAMIEKDGMGGYMYLKHLTYVKDLATPEPTDEVQPTATPGLMDEVPAVVVADELAVYKKASSSSQKLGTLKKGAEVTVMAYNTNWAYIKKDGKFGYCKVSGLQYVDDVQPTPTVSPVPDDKEYIPAVVVAEWVPVFEEASAESTKLGRLKKGAKVNVVSYDKTWAYIEKNGKFGYCKIKALSKRDVQPTPQPEIPDDDNGYRDLYPDVQFTATVIYEYAPVYAEPSTDSMSTKLSLATAIDVYAYNSSWAYVGIGEARGFMQVKYLSAAAYTELKSGDSSADVAALQEELLTRGYFDGMPGTSFTAMTSTAVKRFQSAIGVTQTGTADVNTLRVLYGGYAPESSLLKESMDEDDSGAAVERVQTRLFHLGYLSKADSIDSHYGTFTVNAVKLFQEEAQLNKDGKVNEGVLRALYSPDAPKLPSGKKPGDYTSDDRGTTPGLTTMPAGLASTMVNLPANATNEEKIEYVIYIGQNQLGKKYVYGTAGPNTFDCTGYTTFCFKKVNVTLGRSAYAQGYQAAGGEKIDAAKDLKRGDLVFFNTISDSDLSDHAGIYLGDGYFMHASSGTSNGNQVCVSNLNSGYYQRVFSWGRRPLP